MLALLLKVFTEARNPLVTLNMDIEEEREREINRDKEKTHVILLLVPVSDEQRAFGCNRFE